MGVNASDNRYLVVPAGSTMTTGYSADLAKGQIGLFDVKSVSKRGAKAISDTLGYDKRFSKFEVRLGIEDKQARTLSNKPVKTLPFKLTEVTKAWIGRPTVVEQKFDEWYLGYDGFDTKKSFVFKPGESYQLDLILWGKPLGYLNLGAKTGQFIVKYMGLIDENYDNCEDEDLCEPVDCRAETLKIVEDLNNYQLPSGEKLSKVLHIEPVLSPTETATKTEFKLWALSYCGSDGGNEIGKVQAQYPNYTVVRDNLTLQFHILAPATETIPNYQTTLPDLIPGCEGCPEGYALVDGGYMYSVQTVGEDFAEDSIPNLVEDSEHKYPAGGGSTYVTFLTSEKLTDAEIAAFLESNEKVKSITYVGEKNEICENGATTSIPWSLVTTATAINKKYTIILQDDCNGTRLQELQEAYPDLTIVQETNPTPANCIRKYSTNVLSDVAFAVGCPDGIVGTNYSFEAPEKFDFNAYWVEESTSSDDVYSCGIYIKAKPVVINAKGECLIDELPFMATSMRVKPAGGYITNQYLNAPVVNRPFASFQVESAKDMDNLGGNMRGFEREGKFYFQNESYYKNVFARNVLGLENQLDGLVQYNMYSFEIDKYTKTQSFGQNTLESITYHMIAPSGEGSAVEELLNAIAVGAGIPVEQL